MSKECFEISNVVSIDWLGIITILILFGLENIMRAGLICHPNGLLGTSRISIDSKCLTKSRGRALP